MKLLLIVVSLVLFGRFARATDLSQMFVVPIPLADPSGELAKGTISFVCQTPGPDEDIFNGPALGYKVLKFSIKLKPNSSDSIVMENAQLGYVDQDQVTWSPVSVSNGSGILVAWPGSKENQYIKYTSAYEVPTQKGSKKVSLSILLDYKSGLMFARYSEKFPAASARSNQGKPFIDNFYLCSWVQSPNPR